MGCEIRLTISLCLLVMCCSHSTRATDTCMTKLSVISELLGGDRGPCECDVSALEEMRAEIRELTDFKLMILEGIRRNPTQYSDICYAGISTGRIPISDISASGSHDHCPLSYVMLNSAKAWCAGTLNANQWVQVDLRASLRITGILTQGRANCCGSGPQYVSSYKVSHGNNTSTMAFYQEYGTIKVFGANSNKDDVVKNVFAHSVTTRYIRIHPVEYNRHMSMRIELLTC